MGVLVDNEAQVIQMANDGISAYAIAKYFGCYRKGVCTFLAVRKFSKYARSLNSNKRSVKKWQQNNREYRIQYQKHYKEKWANEHNNLAYSTWWYWINSDKYREYNKTARENFKLKHGMYPSTYYAKGLHIQKRIAEGDTQVVKGYSKGGKIHDTEAYTECRTHGK